MGPDLDAIKDMQEREQGKQSAGALPLFSHHAGRGECPHQGFWGQEEGLPLPLAREYLLQKETGKG